MILTVAQQQYAVDHMVGWLAHPNELGEKPEKIEIDRIFDFEGQGFVVLKFKKKGSDIWSFGVCGGFVEGRVEDDGIIWSELEPYNEQGLIEKCKVYINYVKEQRKNDIFIKIASLRDEKKWQEIVELVDSNIEKYKMPREGAKGKCFQFGHMFDMLYYQFQNPGQKYEWVKNQEASLLQRKLFALIEMNDDRAFEVADEILKLSPYDVPNMNEVAELYKARRDFVSCKKQLEKMYPYIWNSTQFAKYIRSYAWLAIEEGNIEAAVHYLSWSLNFDSSDSCIKFVDGELGYIQNKYGFKQVPRPSFKKSFEYFTSKQLKVFPSRDAVSFSMNLYDLLLRNKEINVSLREEAKRNLIAINSVWGTGEVDAKMVEVNVLTENRLVVNFKYLFNFEVNKTYQNSEVKGDNIIELQSAVDSNSHISIRAVSAFETDAQFEKIVDGAIEVYKASAQDIYKEEVVEFVPGKGVKKIIMNNPGGGQTEHYYVKLNTDVVGEVIVNVTDENKQEIRKVLKTWEFFN